MTGDSTDGVECRGNKRRNMKVSECGGATGKWHMGLQGYQDSVLSGP